MNIILYAPPSAVSSIDAGLDPDLTPYAITDNLFTQTFPELPYIFRTSTAGDDRSPYIAYSLDIEMDVGEVRIYTPPSATNFLKNAVVRVGNVLDPLSTDNPVCWSQGSQASTPGSVIRAICSGGPKRGSYVVLQNNNDAASGYAIEIVEMEVYQVGSCST